MNAQAWLGRRGLDLATVDGLTLRDYAESLPWSRSSRAALRSAVAAYWRFVERFDGPASAVRVPKQRRMRCKALEEDAAATLVDAARARKDRKGLAVLLGLYAGLRVNEVATLRWSDIEAGWVTLIGKQDRQRSLPLHPHLAEALESHGRTVEWVFPGRFGGPQNPTTVWGWVRRSPPPRDFPPSPRMSCATPPWPPPSTPPGTSAPSRSSPATPARRPPPATPGCPSGSSSRSSTPSTTGGRPSDRPRRAHRQPGRPGPLGALVRVPRARPGRGSPGAPSGAPGAHRRPGARRALRCRTCSVVGCRPTGSGRSSPSPGRPSTGPSRRSSGTSVTAWAGARRRVLPLRPAGDGGGAGSHEECPTGPPSTYRRRRRRRPFFFFAPLLTKRPFFPRLGI